MPIVLRLDRVMADRKMSLNALAEKVGIANVNLSKIKTGKVSAIRFPPWRPFVRRCTVSRGIFWSTCRLRPMRTGRTNNMEIQKQDGVGHPAFAITRTSCKKVRD